MVQRHGGLDARLQQGVQQAVVKGHPRGVQGGRGAVREDAGPGEREAVVAGL